VFRSDGYHFDIANQPRTCRSWLQLAWKSGTGSLPLRASECLSPLCSILPHLSFPLKLSSLQKVSSSLPPSMPSLAGASCTHAYLSPPHQARSLGYGFEFFNASPGPPVTFGLAIGSSREQPTAEKSKVDPAVEIGSLGAPVAHVPLDDGSGEAHKKKPSLFFCSSFSSVYRARMNVWAERSMLMKVLVFKA
jgi:hypothetical protein